MDFDLEIISEESDCPEPLFDSILNAMNSMKEATADKIYQKIQKEGETSYSKPQVGRALASALKYGIFEIKNNRYRVKDDILDDRDIYWKLQKKREETPFRIQDDSNDRQIGPKLDPERDNQRFKTITNKGEKVQECPHCGRIKRPKRDHMEKLQPTGSQKSPKKRRRQLDRLKGTRNGGQRAQRKKAFAKRIKETISEERVSKKRKTNEKKRNDNSAEKDTGKEVKDAEKKLQEEKFDTSDSKIDLVSPPSNDQSFKSGSVESKTKYPNQNKQSRSLFSLECVDTDDVKAKRSNSSLKFDSESDQMDVSSFSFDQGRAEDFESLPCTSTNTNHKTRNQYLGSSEMYRNHYERNQTEQCQENSDWLRCSDEPQAKITLSNNGLTIQPIDTMAFSSPGQASYIS